MSNFITKQALDILLWELQELEDEEKLLKEKLSKLKERQTQILLACGMVSDPDNYVTESIRIAEMLDARDEQRKETSYEYDNSR